MTTREDVARVNAEHPDWTARQIADHLGVERYHVYNAANALGLKLAPAPFPAGPAPAAHAATAAQLPAVPTPSPPKADDFTVYANSPGDMVAAQKSLIEWCAAKIEQAGADHAEAKRNFEGTLELGWSSGWERQMAKERKKIEFYTKVMGALELGYYIVPNFPIDVFAIRTARVNPDKKTSISRWDPHLQDAQLLAAGEGRYVSDSPVNYQRDVDGPTKDGKTTTITEYFAKEFVDVDFPFKLARAEIMQATQAAMALKIFDRVGCLPNRRRTGDPIICGQILMPHRQREPVTFFVSWWLDTRMI